MGWRRHVARNLPCLLRRANANAALVAGRRRGIERGAKAITKAPIEASSAEAASSEAAGCRRGLCSRAASRHSERSALIAGRRGCIKRDSKAAATLVATF